MNSKLLLQICKYNIDETGLDTVNKSGAITAPNGYKKVTIKRKKKKLGEGLSSGVL